ncbi:ABC transporter permease [Planctomycetota bacterium]
MRVFRAIYLRELKGYFSTPVGYVFLVVFLIGNGFITFAPGWGGYYISRQAHLRPMFDYIPYLFIFMVPAVAMRLWSEERRSGTAELLFSLPVKVSQAVLAKFFAAWSVICIALVLTTTLVMITYFLGEPDTGPIITSYLGAVLLGGAYLAIGCFCSALSKNQVISFILAVIGCIFFLKLGSPPVLNLLSNFMPGLGLEMLEAHSLETRFESMQRGVLNLSDLVFFFAMIVAWLIACGIVLDYKKAE